MYDTCLFALGGQSLGLSSQNVYELSPVLMAVIYLFLLAVIIVSVTRKKDHIATTMANLILSIPIFAVLIGFAPFYPPFGKDEAFVLPICAFLLYVYLSALIFTLFLVWYIVSARAHKINPVHTTMTFLQDFLNKAKLKPGDGNRTKKEDAL